MQYSFFWVSCFTLLLPSQELNESSARLKKAPSILGDTYQCGEMVDLVNHLRRIGKNRSLASLRKYLASGGEDDKVLVICRLLFVNPKGWDAPVLGKPVPDISEDAAKKFPLFPIALSEGVPFLLVKGYSLKGQPESAAKCLQRCEGFVLVKEDYPSAGSEKAARALTKTESFRQLYDKNDLPDMSDIIVRQSKKPRAAEDK
jgi:hypothetical protein